MTENNYIKSVAIVGAGGNLGTFITAALLKANNHTITALTRTSSQTVLPPNIKIKQIDYSNPSTIISALQDQDALVITLSGMSLSSEEILIRAAITAGVKWILPNEWASDTANEALVKDVPPLQMKVATRKSLEQLGAKGCISLCTGYWYEWSLGKPDAFGFDIKEKRVTFFDEGEARVSMSTWPQIGSAVAALLSLPVSSESGPCLDRYGNKVVYVNSFTVSQKDILASVLRVTGTKQSEWTVVREPSHERRATGLKEISEGNMSGYPKAFLTRVFYPDGCGDFETHKGTLNYVLGLPEVDIDVATKIAIERQGVKV